MIKANSMKRQDFMKCCFGQSLCRLLFVPCLLVQRFYIISWSLFYVSVSLLLSEIDNGLFSPPPLATVSPTTNGTSQGSHSISVSTNGYHDNKDGSANTSMESSPISTQTGPVAKPQMATTPTQTITDTDPKEKEKRGNRSYFFKNLFQFPRDMNTNGSLSESTTICPQL